MFRMLLLLCAGLFLTLQIGGADRGQVRFGLMEAEGAPTRVTAGAAVASSVLGADGPEADVAEGVALGSVADSPLVQPASASDIVPVAFVPSQPLVTPVAQADPVEAAQEVMPEVLYVQGRAVNVRAGPSTRDAVVGRLTRGEAVTVVEIEDTGWARVRIEGDGIDGFMSMSFLSGNAP